MQGIHGGCKSSAGKISLEHHCSSQAPGTAALPGLVVPGTVPPGMGLESAPAGALA